MSIENDCARREPGRFSNDALTKLDLARREVRARHALARAFQRALDLPKPPSAEAMRDVLADIAGGPHITYAADLADPLERHTRLIETLLEIIRTEGADAVQARASRPLRDFLGPR